MKISGEFEVKITPQASDKGDAGAGLGRMSLDKQYRGELEATSVGEMLTAMTSTKGSAAYVAVERVAGTLGGKPGTFMLHHTGVMNRGAASLEVKVVPDSGTGELAGLEGALGIRIEQGKHFYDFDYALK
ncbi:hypothetical protein DSM104443_01448 [Usitatibacter rugosus]|uniref:DUF3224 domain-containing protein n=1 Tax=Usitatibacter rugosus TaxID=2732067 RepID=A0A6M4GSU0_9PROT|nr:DUF3224 domain-containing protein [Usitatibacter rugosus]QJR10390.1 hypothetical protein DSM104443_01448 [Usitatibacter rugosus]